MFNDIPHLFPLVVYVIPLAIHITMPRPKKLTYIPLYCQILGKPNNFRVYFYLPVNAMMIVATENGFEVLPSKAALSISFIPA